MAYDKRLRRVAVNVAAAGTVTLIPGGQLGPGYGSIKVYQVLLNGAGANNLSFGSNGVALYPITFTAAGASSVLQDTNTPWFETLPGQGLTLTTSTTAAVTGEFWYALA